MAWLGDYGLETWAALVRQWKFNGRWRATQDLLPAAGPLPEWAVGCRLVPAPQSRWRFAERGYNQAAVWANHIGGYYGLPVQQLLIEKGRQRPVHLLKSGERSAVKRRISLARRPHQNRKIILVDDILTTGATLMACHLALRAGGLKVVGALVLTRTPRRVASGGAVA